MTTDRTHSSAESTHDVPNPPSTFYEVMSHRADRSLAGLGNNSRAQQGSTADEVFGKVLIDNGEADAKAIDWAEKNFDRMDANKNGFVTTSEMLGTYRRSQQSDQSLLHALHYLYLEIQNSSNDEWGTENDGITREDLAAYDTVLEHRERARRSRWDE